MSCVVHGAVLVYAGDHTVNLWSNPAVGVTVESRSLVATWYPIDGDGSAYRQN